MREEDRKQQEKQHWKGDQTELSSVWLELLGLHAGEKSADWIVPDQRIIPTLEGDPWRKLLEAEDVEHIDLEKKHLPISEREVEQMLQFMHDQAAQNFNTSQESNE